MSRLRPLTTGRHEYHAQLSLLPEVITIILFIMLLYNKKISTLQKIIAGNILYWREINLAVEPKIAIARILEFGGSPYIIYMRVGNFGIIIW